MWLCLSGALFAETGSSPAAGKMGLNCSPLSQPVHPVPQPRRAKTPGCPSGRSLQGEGRGRAATRHLQLALGKHLLHGGIQVVSVSV